MIRPAVPADLEQIARIERASFSDPWPEEAFASSLDLPHMHFLVAEERAPTLGASSEQAANMDLSARDPFGAPRILGYVIALLMADEAEVADLAVAHAARRRGIARLLLQRVAVEAAERGAQAIYLEVRESNAAALALYASHGFAVVGRRRGYYHRPPEDALVLRRDLAPA